jgi:hypothetical protein
LSQSVVTELRRSAKVGVIMSGNTNRVTDIAIKSTASFGAGPQQLKSGSEVTIAASKLCAIGCE